MSTVPMRRAGIAGWCLLVFVATAWLHTRHNDFPWYYHPDEPGKVEQVMGTRPWNFHHPMLLLSATKLAVTVSGVKSEQAVAETGRTVSALFTAGAVVVMVLIAMLARGWGAGVITGLALMLHHQLFELSHYMKEDPALLFGLSLTFLAGFVFEKWPSPAAAAMMGLACGIAISGKYLGFIALAVPVIVLTRSGIKGAWPVLIFVLLATFAAVNLPLLGDWERFSASFARESRLVVEGQGEITQRVPHSRYWSIFLANSTPVMWVLILVAVSAAIRRRALLSAMEWTTLGFPFAFAIALSFSPKDNDRYFLPATAMFTLLAVAGISYLADLLRARFRPRWTEAIAGLALVAAQFPSWTDDRGGLVRYVGAFQHDDTAELVEWLRANVPLPAMLAKDEKVRLPTPLRHGESVATSVLPHRILSDAYAADLGSFEELQARGVTHVITTPSTYQKFERAGFRPKQGQEDLYTRRKLFYAALRRDFDDPVWMRKRGTVIYLHPGLEVYRIAK